jgi:hypothetical protein
MIIERDRAAGKVGPAISILDLGCGVGHGARYLADIPGAQITAIDSAAEALDYARRCYLAPNVRYVQADAVAYAREMPTFDYVVSRNVLEHIPDGLALLSGLRWRARLALDVPFDEPVGNPHHHLHHLHADAFAALPQVEIFLQDHAGRLDVASEGARANVLMVIATARGLPPVGQYGLSFPLAVWQMDAACSASEVLAGALQIEARLAQLVRLKDEQADSIRGLSDHLAQLERMATQVADAARGLDARLASMWEMQNAVVQRLNQVDAQSQTLSLEQVALVARCAELEQRLLAQHATIAALIERLNRFEAQDKKRQS